VLSVAFGTTPCIPLALLCCPGELTKSTKHTNPINPTGSCAVCEGATVRQ
jgi:hypothetical protein